MSKKMIKLKFQAQFHRLQINKNIKFQTKILWKRHINKSESTLVNHEHGFSIFNQTLSLDINLQFNEEKGIYEDKNTEIVAIIMYEGKTKSGGYAKYNISQVVNQNLANKLLSIPLTQCPDPNANVQVTFTYIMLEQNFDQTMSVLNASSRDLNMSRVDFNDDKLSLEMDRISATIKKFNQLAEIVKNREKSSTQKIPELMTRLEVIEGEKVELKKTVSKLQAEIQKKEEEYKSKSKEDKKLITQLQKKIQKQDKQIRSKEYIQFEDDKKAKISSKNIEDETVKYKKLYEELQKQLEEIKSEPLRGSLGFGNMEVDDVHEIANFSSAGQIAEKEKNTNQIIENLKAENSELQGNVASMSYKLAQLFNASYEFGGAKLLDYLQTSIGLTEM